MPLKLVDLTTGDVITPDRDNKLTIQRTYPGGVTKGEKFTFGELVAPCDEYPHGLVKSKKTEMSWVQYVPDVFNAKIVNIEE